MVEKYPESQSCDELYFNRQVLFWQDYKVANMKNVKCEYSRPNYLHNKAWYQNTEKLARNYLFFSDPLSHTEPGKGVMITYWLVGEEPALRAARFSSDQKDFDDGCHYLV